jgi:GTP-binding protein HflX
LPVGSDYSVEESLDELAALAESAGAAIADRALQSRPAPDAATLVGSGKVAELTRLIAAQDADVVIFDHDLTPTQQRNLERALDTKVIDRTQLILDIFARHARTREGQLQVELAQLNYLLPRLTGHGHEMSRLGGGIGTRGPGETQLETDRRRIFRRLSKIKEDIEKVRANRAVQRRQRESVPLATVALVGYTNAGKSTLFNTLTGAGVLTDPKMFATLDPTVRAVALPSRRRILASDTVGFIRNLPTTLVKAFRATLEEVAQAALILHVVDVSSPHASEQTAQTLKVLSEIGAEATPQILALNKVDLLPESSADAEAIRRRIVGDSEGLHARAVAVSARTGQGVGRLLQLIDEVVPFDPVSICTFRFPLEDGARVHMLHQSARVIATSYTARYCQIEAEVPESVKAKLAGYLLTSPGRER